MRPLGVTLIAIYQILRGVLGVCFALGLLLFSGLASRLASFATETNAVERMFHNFGRVAGLGILVFAVLHVVASLGLFKMRNWARLLTLLFSAIGLVILLPVVMVSHGLPLVFGIINAASIFYLAAPPIKRAFHAGGPALRAAA
ncbi:MAG: hypothetical protein WAQ52_17340 [Terriglobales bacterium]